MDLFVQILLGIVPSLGVGLLFYLVIKSLVEGDRRERKAYAQWQARQDAQEKTGEGDLDDVRGGAESSLSEDRERETR